MLQTGKNNTVVHPAFPETVALDETCRHWQLQRASPGKQGSKSSLAWSWPPPHYWMLSLGGLTHRLPFIKGEEWLTLSVHSKVTPRQSTVGWPMTLGTQVASQNPTVHLSTAVLTSQSAS